MKVLHIIPSLKKGGAERLVLDICIGLQKRKDFEVALLLLHHENEYEYLSKSLQLFQCSSFFRMHLLKRNESDFSSYRKIISDFNPSVIHSHLFEAEFFSRACLFPGIKYFSHLHDNMHQFENFTIASITNRSKWTNLMEKHWLLKQYEKCHNHFIANSDDTSLFFRKHLSGELKDHIAVLNNGIDLSRFQFVSRPYPTGTIRLVSVGSLVGKKNHAFLLQVVKNLIAARKNIHLDILGEGPLKGPLQRLIDEQGLQNVIQLHGNVDDVESYLNASHLYVHPATYEPFGLAIAEAMATGLPVVCLNGAGNRGIIKNGKNGFILSENNPVLFAQRILEILSVEEIYYSFSATARNTSQQYDIVDYVNRLVNLYQEIL